MTSGNPDDDIVTMYVYGTRPDGEAYAGTFEINPWTAITPGSNEGTVGELVTQMNQVFAQGSDRFANARLENGNLLINSLGAGDGFSCSLARGNQILMPLVPQFRTTPSLQNRLILSVP